MRLICHNGHIEKDKRKLNGNAEKQNGFYNPSGKVNFHELRPLKGLEKSIANVIESA